MKKSALAILTSLFFATAQADVVELDVADWNNHTYTLISVDNVIEAMDYAYSIDAYLISINSEEENQFLLDTWADVNENYGPNNGGAFIGLNDTETEGEFAWNTGEILDYTNWRNYEPNDYQGAEDFVSIYLNSTSNVFGLWNDVSETYNTLAIIEQGELGALASSVPVAPIGAAAAMLAFGLFGIRRNSQKSMAV